LSVCTNSFAQTEKKKPWWAVGLGLIGTLDVDVQMGHSDVINGVLYNCIRNGLCYVHVSVGGKTGSEIPAFFVKNDQGELVLTIAKENISSED